MPTILLIKTSSLGDVVHNLPVVSDVRAALGEVAIDWVVEAVFSAIPAMHPGVRRVIPCELRRWRRSWLARATREAWRGFVADLRRERYDFVIDTQGLLKSAIVARAANGRRVGLDWKSSREPLRLFYDRVFSISRALHAVERNRRLAALALGYEVRGPADYGIQTQAATAAWLPQRPYVGFLHGTSHPRKLWPEPEWLALGRALAAAGYALVLPWGSALEHERAQRLAAALPAARVAPRLSLADAAQVLAGARAVVGVDTGLSHLAAALGVPVVGIYGATDPQTTGLHAAGPVTNLGSKHGFPSAADVVAALRGLGLAIG